jgi:hypothetical protein
VRRWIIPRLDRLQPEHLDAFYTWLAGQELKPNAIVQIHRILSRALKIAWKRGKVGYNVAMLVDAPVGEEIDIEALSREEARRILAAAADRRNGARWSVALAVGILWVPKTCATCADVLWASARSRAGTGLASPSYGWRRRACDDRRLVGLRLIS